MRHPNLGASWFIALINLWIFRLSSPGSSTFTVTPSCNHESTRMSSSAYSTGSIDNIIRTS